MAAPWKEQVGRKRMIEMKLGGQKADFFFFFHTKAGKGKGTGIALQIVTTLH